MLIVLWYVLIKSWERNGTLDKWNATRALGIVLMVRTQRGQAFLEQASKPRRFWRAYGEVSLWLCSITILMVGVLVIFAFISSLLYESPQDPPSASELVAIPGLNPMIPLGWGAIAFVISLVIHEFGHGLQARAHGMRVRSFGLLQLGPLPLGAFAEPQHEELMRAPRRERMRMFAAGPATNLFAAVIMLILIGGASTQLMASEQYIHVTGIVKDSGADIGGMEPWDTILSINGTPIRELEDFQTVMGEYEANESIEVVVRNVDGERETLTIVLGDKYDYYLALGWNEDILEQMGIQPKSPFLGVEGMSEGTAGVDRLAGPLSPRWEGSFLGRLIQLPFHLLSMMLIPFEFQGVAMHPFEETMLTAGDGIIASLLGTQMLIFLTTLFFWIMWVNILLGFTNLIPMVPFDGGHMLRDMVHAGLSWFKSIGRRFKLWDLHPMWVEHFSSKASSYSSLVLLVMLLTTIFIPYF